MTKIKCPKCGAEISVPEINGVVLTVHTPYGATKDVKLCTEKSSENHNNSKSMKASEKLAALAAAGVDVSNLFSMSGITGEETIGRIHGGQLSIIPDDDPIFAALTNGKTVPNRRLFRRWVMAQMFHMLAYKEGRYGPEGFTAALNAKGFKYQWRMMVEEYRVQAVLEEKDPENFAERNRWFDRQRFYDAATSYISELQVKIDKMERRRCKGIPYVHLRGRNVFVTDLQSKVFEPLRRCVTKAMTANTACQLYRAVSEFYSLMKRTYFKNDMAMSMSFKDAYKGSGAYFTMKNLILFHGASFKNGCVKIGEKQSLALLERKAVEYAEEGWRMFGLMKKLIADSNIDILKKMEEWQNK